MITTDPTLLVALAVVVKATALLGIAAIMQLVVFRRASAATRHLVWTIALVSVLLLPVVSLVGPAWTVEIPAAQKPVSVTPAATSADAPLEIANGPASPVIALESTPAPPRAANVSWSAAFIIVYCAGAIGLLIVPVGAAMECPAVRASGDAGAGRGVDAAARRMRRRARHPSPRPPASESYARRSPGVRHASSLHRDPRYRRPVDG